MQRRDVLGLGVAGMSGALGVVSNAAAAKPTAVSTAPPPPRPPDLSFLREGPLVNVERAREWMAAHGLDAIVATQPANVFYLTGHWPQLDRMGLSHTALAILPRDPARPPALIMHAFLHYYTHSDETPAGERWVFTYTLPDGGANSEMRGAVAAGTPGASAAALQDEPTAAAFAPYRILEPSLVSARETRRRAAAAATRGNAAGPDWALRRALRELRLDAAVLGVDHIDIATLVTTRGLNAKCLPAENTLRRIRLVKSPREIALMRLAAQANVDAAMAAAQTARSAGTTRILRSRYFAEAAARGLMPVFMVIDGSSSEVMDAELRDGSCFSIDCVSSLRFYHGDFARTIFVGEPSERMRKIVAATRQAWDDVRGSLRPGLRFAEVQRIGRESLKRQGADINISFTPHSVGLFHTDHPFPSAQDPRPVGQLTLEAGMILSVDCPLGMVGSGGSSHLEDLSLITADGAEPIHSVPTHVIVV